MAGIWTTQDLADVRAALKGLALNPASSYTVAGRSVTHRDLGQLRALLKDIEQDLRENGLLTDDRSIFVQGVLG